MVRGIWAGGALTLGLNLMQMACAVVPPLAERITGNSAPNSSYAGADGHVVSTDANHIVVREGLAELGNVSPDTVTFVVTPETRFHFEGPAWRKQPREAGLDWLRAGDRVRVDYFMKDRQKHAKLVVMWVETPLSR